MLEFETLKNFISSTIFSITKTTQFYFYYKLLATFTILTLLRKYYFNGPKNPKSRKMQNQIAIITGASAGLGKETVKDLLNSGATVLFACRNKQKTYQ